MNRKTVQEAIDEAERFLKAARTLLDTDVTRFEYVDDEYKTHTHKWNHYDAPKQSGAVRRASMDLTRALAEMRRP